MRLKQYVIRSETEPDKYWNGVDFAAPTPSMPPKTYSSLVELYADCVDGVIVPATLDLSGNGEIEIATDSQNH
jgi:hypothetical protein